MKYIFEYNGKMPSYIIEFIPFIDELEGTSSRKDRKTGHTVNIYGNEVTESLKREVYLSPKFIRVCPRDSYFLEEAKEISPIVEVFPLSECPIYEKLKAIEKIV